jgi:hypothetical protein
MVKKAPLKRADYIKCAVSCYFRYVKQYPVVSIETKALLTNAGRSDRADILAMDKEHFVTEIEVKSSLTDLKNDVVKRIHKEFKTPGRNPRSYPVHYFYFAIHEDLKAEALEHIRKEHPYAGILVIGKHHSTITEPEVTVAKEPTRMLKPPLNPSQVIYLLRAMSSTICRQMYSGNFPGFPIQDEVLLYSD